MGGLLERIGAAFDGSSLHQVEVPEWGEEGKPLVVYFTPITLKEMSLANEAARGDPVMFNARIVALKALDKAGNRLFSMVDALFLAEKADPAAVIRIASAISPKMNMADVEKN